MGALATPPKWIPEDDLLLKNAVEAGASLESLAKGAVRFSRRFTLRELLERWHSLLYDPDVSAEASARMIEFEMELSSSNPPKAARACSLKGKDSSSEKRKGDSIRSHYHAWRKRICNRPYTSVHPDLPETFCSEIIKNCGYDCGDSLNDEYQQHQRDSISLQEHKVNYFEHSHAGCENDKSVFPGMLGFNSNAPGGDIVQNGFHNECIGSNIDRCTNRTEYQNPLHVYTENLCLEPGDKTEFNDASQSLENDYIQKEHSQDGNLITFDSYSEVHEMKQLDNLPTGNQCVSEDAEVKPLPITASIDDSHKGIVGNNNMSMQVSRRGDSFHQVGCSSHSAELALWETIPGISGETMALDMHLDSKEKSKCDDNNELNAPGFCNAASEANMNDGTSDGGINNSAMVTESYLMMDDIEFDDDASYLCFDKDVGSFLDLPSDTHQEDISNSSEPKEIKIFPTSFEIPDATCFVERNGNDRDVDIAPQNDHTDRIPEKDTTSILPKGFHATEPLENLPPCLLNTEDTEIPDNDHVSVPAKLLPHCSAPFSISSADGRSLIGDLAITKEEQLPAIQTSGSSLNSNSAAPLNVGLAHSVDNCMLDTETFRKVLVSDISGDDLHVASNNQSLLQDMRSAPHSTLEGDHVNCGLQKSVKFNVSVVSPFEKPAHALDHTNMCPPNILNGCKKELNMQSLHDCAPGTDLVLPQPLATMSTSDLDDRLSESEDDVPTFSDIEAMILEMDLGPYDQESCLFNKEVSQYQPIHSKKTIIRLEQGARAYMNRKVSAHGAFAVFYGHHLKYFIRTPQISLGRATEDVKVDIDLGREGRANKISRRQAIIKMDDDGSFFLKNVGKYSIFLNSREISSQKCVNLTSGSLIEIRNLTFIFEINQNAVRSYVTTVRKKNQGRSTGSDWKPSQNL